MLEWSVAKSLSLIDSDPELFYMGTCQFVQLLIRDRKSVLCIVPYIC